MLGTLGRISIWVAPAWVWGLAALRPSPMSCAIKSSDWMGKREFVVYTAPVGTIRESDKAREQAFYQFVTDEGL